MELTDGHRSVLEAVAKGAVTQRGLAINLRLRPAGPGHTWAADERELVDAGYIQRPVRLAELLHRRCSAKLTMRGWHALVWHLASTHGEAARRRTEREG